MDGGFISRSGNLENLGKPWGHPQIELTETLLATRASGLVAVSDPCIIREGKSVHPEFVGQIVIRTGTIRRSARWKAVLKTAQGVRR